jgi:hypothetical protein
VVSFDLSALRLLETHEQKATPLKRSLRPGTLLRPSLNRAF